MIKYMYCNRQENAECALMISGETPAEIQFGKLSEEIKIWQKMCKFPGASQVSCHIFQMKYNHSKTASYKFSC